jgi:hypothetical protein
VSISARSSSAMPRLVAFPAAVLASSTPSPYPLPS